MYVHTYQFQNINGRKEQLLLERAFETTMEITMVFVIRGKKIYETKHLKRETTIV